jgi:catechol 2,3-dioxygenase-like lactoylglutathione lyase family enzyme
MAGAADPKAAQRTIAARNSAGHSHRYSFAVECRASRDERPTVPGASQETQRPRVWQGLRAVIEVERVDFVSVPTRDVSRARRFYAEVLGLRPSTNNPDEFETANLTLALWQPEADGVPFTPNTAGIALRVGDVEAAVDRLRAAGVEFIGETLDTGVCLMGFFYDPDGNVLILHRRYAPL